MRWLNEHGHEELLPAHFPDRHRVANKLNAYHESRHYKDCFGLWLRKNSATMFASLYSRFWLKSPELH